MANRSIAFAIVGLSTPARKPISLSVRGREWVMIALFSGCLRMSGMSRIAAR
jgi:hypothetical protein